MIHNPTKILAIDTSCDETAAAVTDKTKILSNLIWSQASLHAKFGGVYPNLAKRMHKEKIDFIVKKALKSANMTYKDIDLIAVTVGPGLAPALEVGIDYAKKTALENKIPLIPINHIEGHIFSSMALPNSKNAKEKTIHFPTLALIASGGTTKVILVKKIGSYKILADTMDDALGEALDKGARTLGLGYPGGAILEKFAKKGKLGNFNLPIPMTGKEDRMKFSYSGLKTALVRLIEKREKQKKTLSKEDIFNLAAEYQNAAFKHLIKITKKAIENTISSTTINDLLTGGGVTANIELKKRLRKLSKEFKIQPHFPYTKRLNTDNAAMIGIAAYLTHKKLIPFNKIEIEKIDRIPRFSLVNKPEP